MPSDETLDEELRTPAQPTVVALLAVTGSLPGSLGSVAPVMRQTIAPVTSLAPAQLTLVVPRSRAPGQTSRNQRPNADHAAYKDGKREHEGRSRTPCDADRKPQSQDRGDYGSPPQHDPSYSTLVGAPAPTPARDRVPVTRCYVRLMRNRRVRLRIAGSVVVLATGALALGLPGSGAEAGVSVPLCSVTQLSPVYTNTTGAMGSRDGEYGFKNLGVRRCELKGYPTVQMLTKTGAPLSTTDRHAAPGAIGITARQVTLGQSSVAYFDIHYASSTGFDRLSCPTSAALRLSAPGETTGLVLHGGGGRIQPYGGTTVHLHCGIVFVTPVTRQRFQ